MESRAKLFGHPIHQMLVIFPAGLLATSVVFDIVHRASGSQAMAMVAHYLIVAGIVGAALAAPFGLIDWLSIPRNTRARALGAWHGSGNLVVVALFVASLLLRLDAPTAPSWPAQSLSFVGAAVMLVTAWMGGELVDRLGVGICDETGLDAPSTLRRDLRTQQARGH